MNLDSHSIIRIETMYGAKERIPSVILQWGVEKGQLSPAEARIHAMKVLEAADAAEGDAFIFEFTRSRLGGDVPAATVLNEFRKWRDKRNTEE
jgi:hypothetical protein